MLGEKSGTLINSFIGSQTSINYLPVCNVFWDPPIAISDIRKCILKKTSIPYQLLRSMGIIW
jgi:hypothetical protein